MIIVDFWPLYKGAFGKSSHIRQSQFYDELGTQLIDKAGNSNPSQNRPTILVDDAPKLWRTSKRKKNTEMMQNLLPRNFVAKIALGKQHYFLLSAMKRMV